MSMKTCPNCGQYINPGDSFCHYCGSQLPVVKQPQTYATAATTNYRGYVQIIGVVEMVMGIGSLIVGILGLVVTGFVIYILVGEDLNIPYSTEVPTFSGGALAAFVGVFLLVGVGLIIAFGAVAVSSGSKLLQFKQSGRTGSMVVYAILLFGFPVGTIIGIAALYILTRSEVDQLLR